MGGQFFWGGLLFDRLFIKGALVLEGFLTGGLSLDGNCPGACHTLSNQQYSFVIIVKYKCMPLVTI